MRRRERQITDRAVIDDILRQGSTLYLAMADNNMPYMVPMNYGYDGTAVFLHAADEGRKLDILRRNPRVCFAVTVEEEVVNRSAPCKCFTRYRSAVGTGAVRFIDDREEKTRALDIIMQHYGTEGPFCYYEGVFNVTTVFRIDIDSLTGKHGGHLDEEAQHGMMGEQ